MWFTTEGLLAEGCVSNVFIVKDSVVYTPSLKTGILPGIARKTVLNLAGKNSIKAEEKELTIDDLLGADEVFITNVIMQVLPVIGIEAHNVGNAKAGADYEKNIGSLYGIFQSILFRRMKIMKIKDCINQIEKIAPPKLAQSWDNTGLLVGDGNSTVKKILLTIDITQEVVKEAKQAGCNFILSYHPVIWDGLKNVT